LQRRFSLWLLELGAEETDQRHVPCSLHPEAYGFHPT
jgi:hypothetical protein